MGRLENQFHVALANKSAIGESRHLAKQTCDDKEKIYSIKTMKKYRQVASEFATYCEEKGVNRMNKAKTLADDYLASLRDAGKSAWTQQTARSALHKLYGEQFTTVQLDQKKRSNITRSRLDTPSARHFSEKNNSELVNLLKHTGLRREEVESLKGNQLHFVNGQAFLTIKGGKGGKNREVPILDNDKSTIALISSTEPNKRVFDHVHSKCNVHGYRADYACSMYLKHARNLSLLDRKQKYFCRKDKAGLVFDRKAMMITSIALGHNRLNIIADNYLYTL